MFVIVIFAGPVLEGWMKLQGCILLLCPGVVIFLRLLENYVFMLVYDWFEI